MKFPLLITLLLMTISAEAQAVKFYQPYGRVKAFLQLSDSQLQIIVANNDGYRKWSSTKLARIDQLENEIDDETAKDTLDPMALGVRYAEIEMIFREMKDQANQTRAHNTDVLDQDQKARLKVLEDALNLFPVILEAEAARLLGIPESLFSFGNSPAGADAGTLIGPRTRGRRRHLPLLQQFDAGNAQPPARDSR